MRPLGCTFAPVLLAAAALLGNVANAAEAAVARVTAFTPQGPSRDVRQVTARFSEPMVSLGDPRAAAPFTVTCAVPGHGRWADTRNWVYDFERDLPAGLSCSLALTIGLRSVAGNAAGGTREFRFNTGGPALRASLPQDGSDEIDTDQAFIVAPDAAVDPATVTTRVACAVDNIAERIPVEILTGAAREAVLTQRRALGFRYFRLLARSEGDSAPTTAQLAAAEADLLVIRCRRSLPADTAVRLVWGAGVRAVTGLATTQDQVLQFRTRPPFTVKVACERVNAESPCLPMRPVRVMFSAPVPRERAGVVLVDAVGKRRLDPRVDKATAGKPLAPVVEELVFNGPFTERGSVTVQLPATLQDDSGRTAANAARFPLKVDFDEAPPLAKFAGEFGILEKKTGGILPVTIRNIESPVQAARLTPGTVGDIAARSLRLADDAQVARWLQRVENAMQSRGEWQAARGDVPGRWNELTGVTSVFAAGDATTAFSIPRATGEKTFEVIGIPLKKEGFYIVEIASPRLGSALLGKPAPRHVATAALVTNLAVHFKWGREGSAVWVTRLDSGKPVARAHVRISGYCGANNLWEGDTDSDGVARVAQSLGEPHGNSGCNDYSPQPLIVSARSGEDYSFTLSAWAQGIAPYDFQLPTGYEEASYLAHTVFDRSLFRAGETVSMKHFVRLKALHGLAVPPEDRRPRNVVIRHIGSGQQYVQPATFAADGTATSTWSIPRDARLGEYSVAVTRTLRTPNTDSADAREYPAGIFRVEQFRVPTMQAVLQPPAAPQVNATRVPLDLYVNYLSGGGAANQQVRLRSLIEPRSVRFADYPDTSFGGDEVREGLEDPNQGDEAFTDWAARFGAVRGESPASTVQAAVVQNLQLDANGAARASIADLPRSTQPRSLVAELEYQDANGERLTTATRIALWPAALAVGISADGWVGKPDALSANVVVVDLAGKPMPAQQVDVTLFQRASYAWRKRLVGGFYAYENKVEVRRLAGGCSGHSDAQGRLKCTLSPGVSGEVILRAASRDAAGNVAFATTSAWVVGEDETWFSPGNTDRMDLLPERKEYQPGETARFQVRMPFRSALALVTVEREGVIESFVRRLSGRNPVIDVPIRGGYAPNVFVSVLAVRGRAGSQAPTALVDLAKPAFRMGAAQIRVGWQDFRLEVGASTPQQIYKVRDVVPVDITVRRANGQPLPAGTEVALAAVDEGLLELAPNPSWQLLAAMMGERRLSVWTSTAQMQVVGKRHYGRKALPPGGGGGRAPARELFDTLLYWNPRVAIDPEGKARINVPLNDSLTAFRVVAIASAGAERFGTGETTLRSSQDLMLHSGLPQVLRERDQFTAVFTARNASPRDMRVVASAQVGNTQLAPQTFALAAGASRALSWPTVAPLGASTLAWTVQIREEAGAGSDALKVSQQVLPAAPVRTLQATLTQLDGALSMPVSRPQDALPGRGGLAVTLMPTLAGVAGGVRDYMLAYPYNCIEQQLSRAVAVNDRASWNTAVERLPLYLDRDGLLRYFPIDWLPGSDTLNSYILALAQESGWPLPDDSRQRMLDGLTAFVAGRVQRDSPLPTADLTLRKLAAIAALARHDAADTAMLGSFAIEPGLWPSSALLDWIDILHRVKNVPQQSTRLQAAQNALRSRLDFQGTRLAFANERADRLPWLMVSGDVIANRAILLLLTAPEWQEDMPRLLRASLGRQVRGHWDLTPANAWGTLALAKFAARFEATKVSGPTQLRLAAGAATPAVTIDNGKGTAQFAWPAGASQLELQHKGTGKPWVLVQSRAAVPLTRALSSGYSIKRSITAVEQLTPGAWSVGDVLRVRLTIDAQADSSWVVVEDPVPAGATILGSGLGGDSALLAGGWQDAGRARVAYQERRQDAYRAYYSYVPKGSFSLEYTLRLNSAGRFNLPPVHAEAMYAPEMLGDLPVAALDVRAAP